MGNIEKIKNAFRTVENTLPVSDVISYFTIGDLKEIIIDAMIQERAILEQDGLEHHLKDWEKRDVVKWHFAEYITKSHA